MSKNQYPVPAYILYITLLTMVICIPMLALSVVNFGLLSIWLNAAVGALILIHHTSYLFITWAHSNRPSSKPTDFLIDPEAEADSKSSESLSPTLDEKSAWEDDTEPDYAMPLPFQPLNIASLAFLSIITSMAFSVMVDITSRGAMKSTLPAERVGSHKWNIKIEIGQTAVLGCAMIALGLNLAVCLLGRRRVVEANEEKEAREFGWVEN
ncbi:hypothetical protein JR316_0007743 [Psilocybe cubensis]|uniref:Uncharacterized protein n=2 Tax=Psilocybe cubensis TaxID=181762 RepID=A0ACB8GUX0_PSICU|nr:hypothetical protein JR316_0007743 [Psilocybe cubensis]KAH9479157.1 hypothetical protein JR316_0007743 [Psilocybe cubensis]